MIFIKLTLKNDGKVVFVNAEKIIDLFLTSNKEATTLNFGGDEYYNVNESPEEIIQKIQESSVELQLIEGVEVSGFDLPDKLKGYIKDFNIEYKFGGYGFNGFKLTECTQDEVFIRTYYPEINDCIKASFIFMDNYLKTGSYIYKP